MCEAGLSVPKVHNLVHLLERVLRLEPLWEACREDLALLSGYAVSYRYPGDSATRETAKEALRRCRRFRDMARVAFRLGDATQESGRRQKEQERPRLRSRR